MIAKYTDNVSQILARQQLCGVGRSRTGQQQVKICIDARGLNLRHQVSFGYLILCQQCSNTTITVGDVKEASQCRLTNIKAQQDNLLTQQCKTHREISSVECLTLS